MGAKSIAPRRLDPQIPRKNNLLPFLSIEKDDKAVYTRRLKTDLALRVGQKIFKRRIGKQSTALNSILRSDLSTRDYEVYEEGFRFCPFTVEHNLLCDLLEDARSNAPTTGQRVQGPVEN